MRCARCGWVLLLVGLAGCPDESKTDPAPATTSSPAPRPETRASGETGPGEGDPGTVGPARPKPHPHPDDGIPGVDRLRTIQLKVGARTLKVWVADTYDTRRLGLMFVRELPEDRGMIFVYPEAERLKFWMKNTYVPLSLAYINEDGTIDQLVDMEPHDTNSHPSRGAVRLVLEVSQGWFRRNGVKLGTRIPGVEDLRGY